MTPLCGTLFVGPTPAIVRALPPIPDLSTFFPVTPIVVDLTNASMLSNHQFSVPKTVPQTHPLATLTNVIQICGPPIQIEQSVEDGDTSVHRYMKVMERGTNIDNVGQRR